MSVFKVSTVKSAGGQAAFLSLLFFLSAIKTTAQNVGIGTTAPQAKLDIKGNLRAGGSNNFLSYDSSGRFTWSNSYIWAPNSQYLMMHSNSAEGLYYGNSQLEYRNQDGTPRFYTNWSNGNGYFYGKLGVGVISPSAKLHVGSGGVRLEGPDIPYSVVPALSMGGFGDLQVDAYGMPGGRFTIKENGNVGIGQTNPIAPLSFGSFTGKKISFFGDGEPYYGIGIQGYLMQIHTDLPGSDIAFGHGSTDLFNETMRIKGTGNVGIGTSSPGYLLDVAQRMRLRSGGNNSVSAGLWLNNNSNTEAAFIGMEDDTHVGLFGNTPAGWKFSMNTNTGALKINGSEGQAGQFLKSGGSSAPSWATVGSMIKTAYALGPSTATVVMNTNTWTTIPANSPLTITVDVKSRLVISGNFSLYGPQCSPCSNGWGRFAIIVGNFFIHNSNPDGFSTVFMEANGEGAYTLSNIMYDVQPGTYTIEFLAIRNAAGNNYSMRCELVSVMAIPID